jgi:HAD superfamily hydrolase (TIGR01509 family)
MTPRVGLWALFMNPKAASVSTLLFDWDGTIVDSHHLGLLAFEQSFAALGIDFDHEIYRQAYSPNWYSVYEAMGLPKEKWQKADDLWIKSYGEQNAQLVEGAKQTIEALRDKGYRLGVVSSGSDCRVNREIRELELDNLFDVIVCNEQMENKKPHPEGLEKAMKTLGRSRMESCYVGDSPEDVEMGKRAGTLTVGVRSIYPTSWKLQNHDPDIYIEAFTELREHFCG